MTLGIEGGNSVITGAQRGARDCRSTMSDRRRDPDDQEYTRRRDPSPPVAQPSPRYNDYTSVFRTAERLMRMRERRETVSQTPASGETFDISVKGKGVKGARFEPTEDRANALPPAVSPK